MKNVIYHEGQWSPEKDSLGFTGDMVKIAKSITSILLDAHNAIERNDADNVCSFYFDSAKRKSTNNTFEDIEDKYNFLKNHCNKIGRAVADQIDMPFYKNIDSFSQGLENIDMQNFSVDNSFGIGHMSYAGNGPRFFRLESLTYMDIMSSSSVFDKILTSEYDLWKSQVNEEDAARVTFEQYRKAVSYVGDYDYKSIRDKQIGRELVFKIGVYTVAAIVAVPCVLSGNAPGALLSFSVASYICGSTSVTGAITGAITGTNPISGRTITSEERWVEGISGGVQVLSGAYGIYTYAPQAISNILNTPAPPIRSVADIVDDVAKEGSDTVDDVASGAKTPSEVAKSWQGTGKYPGIDKFKDITLKEGKIVYRGEPNGTEYFTTKSAIERSGNNATKIFEGLQVEKNPIHGYRETMQGYKALKDVDAAMGITKANPQFGQGGLPQVFVPNVDELIKQGILIPVDSIPLIK